MKGWGVVAGAAKPYMMRGPPMASPPPTTPHPWPTGRTAGHRHTSISGDVRADWSEAFALVPSLQVGYVWYASAHTLEVLAGPARHRLRARPPDHLGQGPLLGRPLLVPLGPRALRRGPQAGRARTCSSASTTRRRSGAPPRPSGSARAPRSRRRTTRPRSRCSSPRSRSATTSARVRRSTTLRWLRHDPGGGPETYGAPDRTRTCDLWVRNPTLYPLSYRRARRQDTAAGATGPGEIRCAGNRRSGSRRSRFEAVPVKESAEANTSAARQGHLSRRLHRLP